jgi:hypothetical protein
MHGVKLSKKITKYCLRDAILRPILFATLAVRGQHKAAANSLFKLDRSGTFIGRRGCNGYIYVAGEGETGFKNFDILHEIKSKISKKN